MNRIISAFFLLFSLFEINAQLKSEMLINIDIKNNIKTIKPFKIFGIDEDEEIIFNRPTSITSSEEYVYIANSYDNNILCLDKNANLVKKIGRLGQGPMEFHRTTSINYNKHCLYVLERGRLQCIDLKKEKSLFIIKSIYFSEIFHINEICVIDSIGILFNNYLMPRYIKEDEKVVKIFSLLEPYTVKNSLVTIRKFKGGSIAINNSVKFAKDQYNNAYINMNVENKIFKFNKSLNLIRTYKIEGEIIDNLLNTKTKMPEKFKKITNKISAPPTKIISHIQIRENYLYILFPGNIFAKVNLLDTNDKKIFKLDANFQSKNSLFNKFTIINNRAYFINTFSFHFGVYELDI